MKSRWIQCLLQLSILYFSSAQKTLHVIHITSNMTSALLSTVNFAVEMVNNDSRVLQGYEIIIHDHVVKKRNPGHAMKAFIDEIFLPPTKIAILGPVFSSQGKVVAEVAAYYNLLEVAYSVTSPLLSDKEKYPLFARTAEDTSLHNPAIVAILRHFNWYKVAKLTQDIEYITPTADRFQAMLDDSNFTTLASTTFSNEPESQLEQMKIYQKKMYGARYQLIHWSGRHGFTNQFKDNENTILHDGCTNEEVLQAGEGMITFIPSTYTQTESHTTPGISGFNSNELEELLKVYQAQHQGDEGGLYEYAFDAVWALALALEGCKESPHSSCANLMNFTYDDREFGRALYKSLTNVTFYGSTGEVEFDYKGDRLTSVEITQIQDGVVVTIGFYDSKTGKIVWNKDHPIKFVGGKPPADSSIVEVVFIRTSLPLYLVMATLGVLGIIYCVICVIFNFIYRNTRLVKMSSPRINTIIACGCGQTFVSILLRGTDSFSLHYDTAFCSARNWSLVLGFTCAFGCMFAKTWRVHVLFTNKKLTRKVVKDRHLLSIVAVVLIIDVVILTIWQIIDPLITTDEYLPQQEDVNSPGVIRQYVVTKCACKHMNHWAGVLYGFKALLLIFGIFFAWETRKVRVEALNDSRQIGVCVYNVVILSAVAVPLMSVLGVDQVSMAHGVVCVSIFICSTTTLVLVFGSKMLMVFQHGNKVDDVAVLPFAASLASRKMPPNSSSRVDSVVGNMSLQTATPHTLATVTRSTIDDGHDSQI